MASIALRLLPFTVTSVIYILHWIPRYGHPTSAENMNYQAVIVKCLPIVSLCGFVMSFMQGHPIKNYAQFIVAGLIFSCIGDAFLVYAHTHFIQGLLSFAIGHLMYTFAFGFRHTGLSILFLAFFIGTGSYFYLWPGLHGEMRFFCALYALLIMVMNWRAMARVNLMDIQWPEVCGCVGALSFYVSDMVLSVNKFRFPVQHGYFIIMCTYYLAQLGISLSVVPTLSRKKLY